MTDADHTQPTERLWTPWRMTYIGGETREPGCVFCNRLQSSNDVESLILHRGEHSFVIMNLYPYNTGHIMLVPNQHASDPAQLAPDTLSEMGLILPSLTNALRRALGCQGFNVGLNIGAIAGAGVEAHLHQHIVPRWQGDANFMPILASTMTIPELIPVTYARLRAEIAREMTGHNKVRFIILDNADGHVLLRDGALPTINLGPDEPAVPAVIRSLPDGMNDVQLRGWAGAVSTAHANAADIALTFSAGLPEACETPWSVVPQDSSDIGSDTSALITRAMEQRAPIR
jgi:ATP adenylyltransferase